MIASNINGLQLGELHLVSLEAASINDYSELEFPLAVLPCGWCPLLPQNEYIPKSQGTRSPVNSLKCGALHHSLAP